MRHFFPSHSEEFVSSREMWPRCSSLRGSLVCVFEADLLWLKVNETVVNYQNLYRLLVVLNIFDYQPK